MGPFLTEKSFYLINQRSHQISRKQIRRKLNTAKAPSTVLKELIANVFAKPGTPSKKRCPFQKPNQKSLNHVRWPITLSISKVNKSTKALSFSIISLNALISVAVSIFYSFQQFIPKTSGTKICIHRPKPHGALLNNVKN